MDNQLSSQPWWRLTWREFLALLIAGTWDTAQIAFFPVTAPGGLSPINLVGSVGVSLAAAYLLGPSVALLPMFILENVPGFDELPTATASVAYIIWQMRKAQSTPQLPPAPPSTENQEGS